MICDIQGAVHQLNAWMGAVSLALNLLMSTKSKVGRWETVRVGQSM